MDISPSTTMDCLSHSQPRRGGVASRYLAAISRSASQDSERPPVGPQQSFPLPSRGKKVTAASASAIISSASPKSTRTERTFPLDQSATSGSSCEDHPSSRRRRPRSASHCTPRSLFHEQDVPAAASSSKAPVPASPSRVRRRPATPTANERGIPLQQSYPSDDSTERDASESSSNVIIGKLNQRRVPSLTESLSGGLRFIWDAKQLWAGCDNGGNQVNVSLEASEGSPGPVGNHEASDDLKSGPALRRSYSEIKSEVTTASTQVVTNRAVDVARRQALAHQALAAAPFTASKSLSTAPSSNESSNLHPRRYSFGKSSSQWNPTQLEAKSVLSVSSNDESSRAAWSHGDHSPPPFPHAVGGTCPQNCKPIVIDRCMRNMALPPAAPPPSTDPTRLSRHISTQARETELTRDDSCEESCQSQSRASSNTVEINSSATRLRNSSFHQAKATFQRRLFLNELPVKALLTEPASSRSGALDAADGMQTKNFTLSGRLRKPLNYDDGALSPPQIQRTTNSPHSSPDPIFCTQTPPSRSGKVAFDEDLNSDAALASSSMESYRAPSYESIHESTNPDVTASTAAHTGASDKMGSAQALNFDRIANAGEECSSTSFNFQRTQRNVQADEDRESKLAANTVGASELLLVPTLSKQWRSRNAEHPLPKPRHVEAQETVKSGSLGPAEDNPSICLSTEAPFDDGVVCNSFLAAVAKFESLKTKSSFNSSGGKDFELEEEKTAFGKSVSHPVSTRCAAAAATGRSRRGLELTLGRRPASLAETEDDDTASVRSIREIFEPAVPKVESENSVSRIRAKFETRPPPQKRPASGPLKDAISKFEGPPQRTLRSAQFPKRVASKSSVESPQDQFVTASSTTAKEDGVNESASIRVQAFSAASQGSKYCRNPQKAPSIPRDRASTPPASRATAKASGIPTRQGATGVTAPLRHDDFLEGVQNEVAQSRAKGSGSKVLLKAKIGDQPQQQQPSLPNRESSFGLHGMQTRSKIIVQSAESTAASAVDGTASLEPQFNASSTKTTNQRDHSHLGSSTPHPNRSKELESITKQLLPSNAVREEGAMTRPDTGTDRSSTEYSSQRRERTLLAAHEALNKHEKMLRPITQESDAVDSRRASPDGAVAGVYDELRAPSASRDEPLVGRASDSSDDDSGSDFSDGVTLDLSLAEVSNLTTPTALLSRTDRSIATEDGDSSDPSSKSLEQVDAEAKRSEASSSQTSEAAAPLLAKALGLRPKSDELSASSFFAKRALIANHWSKTSTLSGGAATVFTDAQRSDPASGDADTDDGFCSGWDLSRVESSFPVTESSSAVNLFDFDSDWRLLPVPGPSIEPARKTPGTSDPPPPMEAASLSAAALDVSSRAKTPTRSNISARASQRATPLSHRAGLGKWPSSNPSPSAVVAGASPSFPRRAPPAEVPLVTQPSTPVSSYALASTVETRSDSSARDSSTWKRRAGVTLSSLRRESQTPVKAIERLPVRLPPPAPLVPNSSTRGPSSSVASSSSTSYGPLTERLVGRHAALLGRLRALKEARIRRTMGIAAHHHQPLGYENPLPDPDETSHSTQSSTQFGGSTFLASLEVD